VDRPTEGQLRKEGRYHDLEVAFDDVVAEEMVKHTVELNPNLPAVRAAHPDLTAEQLALQAAWDKAESLRIGFAAEGSPVVPLLLVQVPDAGAGDQRIDATLAFFEAIGLLQGTEIATWLDKKHSPNLAGISANDSPVRVLLFKHAVATGWDCPRALVQFRDIGSTTFAIQTLGRILRMPELRHYPNADLNTAYVYSDLDDDDVTVSCDDEPDRKVRDTTLRVRSDLYGHGLSLVSVWAPRQRLHEYVSHSIAGHLAPRLDTAFAGLPRQPVTRAAADILVDASIDTAALVSLAEDLSVTGERLSADLSEERVRVISDALLVLDTRPYLNKRDSLFRIKTVVQSWFRANRPDYDIVHVAIACLLNRDALTAAIHDACVRLSTDERTQAEEDARSARTTVYNWEVPDNQRVSQASFQPATGPFLMVPALARCVDSDPESDFEKWLVGQGAEIRWWWRNGGRDTTSLAVPYPDEAGVADGGITYPDYLVMTTDGVLWVVEVKGLDDPEGCIDGPTHRKAKGLRAWATEMNQPTRFPGLVGAPRVSTAVVVPHSSGTSTAVKCGNPDSWQPPTAANLAADSGWAPFSFS
jgi:type III restriction enzyme